MQLVVALSPNNMIGDKDGNLLYHDKEDMKLFKEWTTGTAVLVGRRTADTFKNGILKDRYNLVYSTKINNEVYDGIPEMNKRIYVTKSSLDDLLYELALNGKTVSLIGGALTYRRFAYMCNLALVNRFYEMPTISDNKRLIKFNEDNLNHLTLVNVIEHENFQTEVYINYERLYGYIFKLFTGERLRTPYKSDVYEDTWILSLLRRIISDDPLFDSKMLKEFKENLPQHVPEHLAKHYNISHPVKL